MSTLLVNEIKHLSNPNTLPNLTLATDGDVTVNGDLTCQSANVTASFTTSGTLTGNILNLTETTTAPMTINSSTKVANLNADLVDGYSPGGSNGELPILGSPALGQNSAPASGRISTDILGRAIPASFVDLDSVQTLENKTIQGDIVVQDGALTIQGLNAALNCTGDINAFTTSDLRLKKNLRPIAEDPLNKLHRMEGLRFDWINPDDFPTPTSVGVIAQQVREVIPEAVTTREDETLAVKYEMLIPLLIEAVKQLSREVDRLKAIVE
jgi:hypothetical protein